MNLIYCCVFHQHQYIELLKLLVQSIATKGQIDKGNADLLVMTSPEFLPIIKTRLSSINLPVKFYTLNLKTLMEASCCKLKIFTYTNIDAYDKLLYLDTDVLINSSVSPLFNIDICSSKIYALEEGTIGESLWGSQFFDFGKFDKTTKAFSAGVIYFCNSPEMKKFFQDINDHIQEFVYVQKNKVPQCLDQPFVVYNSFMQDRYDNQLMKEYLENNPIISTPDKIIYHFPGGPGDYASKLDKMNAFFTKLSE